MTTSPQLYMTLSEVLHQENFPQAVLNVISPVADHIAYLDSYILGDGTDGMILAQIQVIDEAVLNLPLVDGLALVVGGGPIELQISRQDDLFEAYLQVDEVRLRFPRSWLQPVTRDSQGNYVVDPDPGHFVEIDIPFGLRVTDKLEFELLLPATQAQPLSLPTAMIGNTGVVIEANDILLRFSSNVALPPGGEALGDDWRGVFIQSAAIYLPKGLGPAVPADLTFQNCYLGTGGFSGQIAADWSPAFSGTFFGTTFGLEHFALSFVQNTITVCDIRGIVQLPFFNAPVEIEIGINLDGTIAAKLTAPGGLYTLSKPGILNMQLQSIGFVVEQGDFITKLSGQLTPQIGGLNWPSFAVKELSIDSQGHVHIDGGWLNLPSQYHLSFYGFTFEIDKLGFGNTSDGGKWIGFNGGLKLVDNIPAGASVDGLRLTWYEDARPPQIDLKGVAVELTVPDVLHFKGAVSYDSSQQEFHGSITLNLMALHMEIDGAAVFGTREGHTYLALYLAADWPAGVPLFATGLGLYGVAGLLVLNMTPNKLPGEEWYGSATTPGWYLSAPTGIVQSIGTLKANDPQAKWIDAVGDTAFGAGVTIGTLGDNGHSFSGRVLLAIVFPGPILLIEGKANLLQDRATLDKDATFRALAVLDVPAGTFDMHLDAHYRNDSSGKLIDVRGGAEAFFSLNDASAWHLYLGEKDQAKRIRAKIFQLFEADAYVMLNSQQLAMGAWIGFNNQWSFGPLSLTLQAWLDSNVLVSWHPVHFQGDLWLHGSIQAGAFGFNVGLTVDAKLKADVFDPFHILGELDVVVNLPFNINFNVSASLEWGPDPTIPALPQPLQEVAIEHFKTTTSWPLPQGSFLLSDGDPEPQPDQYPLVPLDSRPHITFSRPVNDDALIGVNAQPMVPDTERIGDPTSGNAPLTVRYGLTSLLLEKMSSTGSWTTVAQAPAATDQSRLYGSWAVMPRIPGNGDPNPGQTKLWLWSKSAFDYTRHTEREWDEWFKSSFSSYPCGPLVENCWDFKQITPTFPLPDPWHDPEEPNLVFSTDAGGSMALLGSGTPDTLPSLDFYRPEGTKAYIDLPQPRNVVRLTTLDRYQAYTFYTSFYGYDAQGNQFGPFTRASEDNPVVEIRGTNLTRIGMTTPVTLIDNVSGAIGCSGMVKDSHTHLVFAEFGDGVNPNGKISAVDLVTKTYTVLGSGYTGPEDIVVANDGVTAYVTERSGNLLRINLNDADRTKATVVSSGITAPQQIALDEFKGKAYVVEYASSGRLLQIDLSSGQQTTVFSGLNNAVGTLIYPDEPASVIYVSEQGTGSVSQITLSDGTNPSTRQVLATGLQSPFFMRWDPSSRIALGGGPGSVGVPRLSAILVPLRDPANRIVRLDLFKTPVAVTTWLNNTPFRPSSLLPLIGGEFIVCSDSVVSGYSYGSAITQICAITADELVQHFEDEQARWSQQGNVLEPYTHYRLTLTTSQKAHGSGELSGYNPPLQTFVNHAYFRTGGPPALETLSLPIGYPGSAGPFKSGLDDLERYVSQAEAMPINATPGAYTVGIDFNENYVDLLYRLARRDLAIHLYDNNGPAHDDQGRLISLDNPWGQVEQLTLTETEISWLEMLSQSGCSMVDPQTILHDTRILPSVTGKVLAPQTLYEARLVPMLLHEDFSGNPPGTEPNPLIHPTLGAWNTQDATGTSQWAIEQTGTAPPYSYFIAQNTTAETTLLWTPLQATDWADYRLSVSLSAATAAPIGIVFRYQNTGNFYRFSLEPQSDPNNSPHWRLLQVLNGQTSVNDVPFAAHNFTFETNRKDYLITIEAVNTTINIYQDDILLFTISEQSPTSGAIGLYCANHPGARFSDVHVEDFRATAPVAYKFSFTTA